MSATPATPESCARALAESLRRQTGVFRAIADLSLRQRPLIDQNDSDGLLRILSEKQKLIEERERLERETAPLRQQWEAIRDDAPADLRAPVEEAWEELLQVMTQIVQEEEAARTQLESQQSQTSQQVTKVQTGKAMLKAYGSVLKKPAGPARYQDQKG